MEALWSLTLQATNARLFTKERRCIQVPGSVFFSFWLLPLFTPSRKVLLLFPAFFIRLLNKNCPFSFFFFPAFFFVNVFFFSLSVPVAGGNGIKKKKVMRKNIFFSDLREEHRIVKQQRKKRRHRAPCHFSAIKHQRRKGRPKRKKKPDPHPAVFFFAEKYARLRVCDFAFDVKTRNTIFEKKKDCGDEESKKKEKRLICIFFGKQKTILFEINIFEREKCPHPAAFFLFKKNVRF